MIFYTNDGENVSPVTQDSYADMYMWSALGSFLILLLLPFVTEPVFSIVKNVFPMASSSFFVLLLHNSFYHLCILFFFALYAAKKHPREPLSAIFDIHRPSKEKTEIMFKCLFLTFVCLYAASAVMTYIQRKMGISLPLQDAVTDAATGSWSNYFVIMIPATVIAPVVEEFMFRRFWFAWMSQRVPKITAAVIVSCIFSLMHMNLLQALPLFVLSMGLQYTYARTKSIFEPIIIHAIMNSSTSLLILLYRLGLVSPDTFQSPNGFLSFPLF